MRRKSKWFTIIKINTKEDSNGENERQKGIRYKESK